ncbi:MAG: chromate efflux transporter [Candidatus Rokubacteria bacterium]|nr:chromate efflux transporter [Candidatus Rokubacteria bacterium]
MSARPEASSIRPPAALREVVGLFLKLGFIGFGGPAAHVALMRDEVVRRRKWVSEEGFLDLLGMTNLIPGPNSTEMAIHLGYVRAGWPGLVAAGACFIAPAMLIVLALAWAYVRYGAQPQVAWLLYGIKPVIIAIVVQATWALLRAAVKSSLLAVVGAAVLGLSLIGANEIALLFGGGLAMMLAGSVRRGWAGAAGAPLLMLLGGPGPAWALAAGGAASASLGTLFLTFLKIGAVLYGSGYVLLAFVRNDFVHRLGWLTDRQLLDAIAIGQFTPGPVLTTATFIGYVIGSWPGAVLATVGIFLPSFVFVAASHPLIPKIRASRLTAGFLDGVNVAALGLMAAVTWELARAAIVDGLTAVLALLAAVLLIRFRANSVWLILGGGAMGIVYRLAVG